MYLLSVLGPLALLELVAAATMTVSQFSVETLSTDDDIHLRLTVGYAFMGIREMNLKGSINNSGDLIISSQNNANVKIASVQNLQNGLMEVNGQGHLTFSIDGIFNNYGQWYLGTLGDLDATFDASSSSLINFGDMTISGNNGVLLKSMGEFVNSGLMRINGMQVFLLEYDTLINNQLLQIEANSANDYVKANTLVNHGHLIYKYSQNNDAVMSVERGITNSGVVEFQSSKWSGRVKNTGSLENFGSICMTNTHFEQDGEVTGVGCLVLGKLSHLVLSSLSTWSSFQVVVLQDKNSYIYLEEGQTFVSMSLYNVVSESTPIRSNGIIKSARYNASDGFLTAGPFRFWVGMGFSRNGFLVSDGNVFYHGVNPTDRPIPSRCSCKMTTKASQKRLPVRQVLVKSDISSLGLSAHNSNQQASDERTGNMAHKDSRSASQDSGSLKENPNTPSDEKSAKSPLDDKAETLAEHLESTNAPSGLNHSNELAFKEENSESKVTHGTKAGSNSELDGSSSESERSNNGSASDNDGDSQKGDESDSDFEFFLGNGGKSEPGRETDNGKASGNADHESGDSFSVDSLDNSSVKNLKHSESSNSEDDDGNSSAGGTENENEKEVKSVHTEDQNEELNSSGRAPVESNSNESENKDEESLNLEQTPSHVPHDNDDDDSKSQKPDTDNSHDSGDDDGNDDDDKPSEEKSKSESGNTAHQVPQFRVGGEASRFRGHDETRLGSIEEDKSVLGVAGMIAFSLAKGIYNAWSDSTNESKSNSQSGKSGSFNIDLPHVSNGKLGDAVGKKIAQTIGIASDNSQQQSGQAQSQPDSGIGLILDSGFNGESSYRSSASNAYRLSSNRVAGGSYQNTEANGASQAQKSDSRFKQDTETTTESSQSKSEEEKSQQEKEKSQQEPTKEVLESETNGKSEVSGNTLKNSFLSWKSDHLTDSGLNHPGEAEKDEPLFDYNQEYEEFDQPEKIQTPEFHSSLNNLNESENEAEEGEPLFDYNQDYEEFDQPEKNQTPEFHSGLRYPYESGSEGEEDEPLFDYNQDYEEFDQPEKIQTPEFDSGRYGHVDYSPLPSFHLDGLSSIELELDDYQDGDAETEDAQNTNAESHEETDLNSMEDTNLGLAEANSHEASELHHDSHEPLGSDSYVSAQSEIKPSLNSAGGNMDDSMASEYYSVPETGYKSLHQSKSELLEVKPSENLTSESSELEIDSPHQNLESSEQTAGSSDQDHKSGSQNYSESEMDSSDQQLSQHKEPELSHNSHLEMADEFESNLSEESDNLRASILNNAGSLHSALDEDEEGEDSKASVQLSSIAAADREGEDSVNETEELSQPESIAHSEENGGTEFRNGQSTQTQNHTLAKSNSRIAPFGQALVAGLRGELNAGNIEDWSHKIAKIISNRIVAGQKDGVRNAKVPVIENLTPEELDAIVKLIGPQISNSNERPMHLASEDAEELAQGGSGDLADTRIASKNHSPAHQDQANEEPMASSTLQHSGTQQTTPPQSSSLQNDVEAVQALSANAAAPESEGGQGIDELQLSNEHQVGTNGDDTVRASTQLHKVSQSGSSSQHLAVSNEEPDVDPDAVTETATEDDDSSDAPFSSQLVSEDDSSAGSDDEADSLEDSELDQLSSGSGAEFRSGSDAATVSGMPVAMGVAEEDLTSTLLLTLTKTRLDGANPLYVDSKHHSTDFEPSMATLGVDDDDEDGDYEDLDEENDVFGSSSGSGSKGKGGKPSSSNVTTSDSDDLESSFNTTLSKSHIGSSTSSPKPAAVHSSDIYTGAASARKLSLFALAGLIGITVI